MRKIGLLAGFLVAAGMASRALADDACPPLTILTSLDMKIGRSGRPFVPMQINGTEEYMLVDTGGFFSELTEPAVKALQLTPHRAQIRMLGVTGQKMELSVSAPFTLGHLHADSADFMVSQNGSELDRDLAGAGGVIAPNLLTSYDVDFDFAGGKINLLSQKHCDGKVVYWPADVVSVVTMSITNEFHIRVPVKLDGHDYLATLDTGASTTTLNQNYATRDFSLKLGDADTPAHGKLNSGHDDMVYVHRFQSLAFEGIAVSNPMITLLPDVVTNKMQHLSGDAMLRHARPAGDNIESGLPDMILGADILRGLHLYVAYKEKKLYITPAKLSAVPAPAPAH